MENDSLTAEALELFQQIIGARAETKDWQHARTFETLKEALELDHSEIIATMLMTYYVDHYCLDTKHSLSDLLTNPAPIEAKLKLVREIREILERAEIVEAMDDFKATMTRGLKHYGIHGRDDVQKIIDNPINLATLRRDALRSVQKLKADQFFSGTPENSAVKPVYFKDVFQWWNINSMLEAAVTMPSGISLNLIRDPNAYHSFFCFLIRNGGNLYVLSDVPQFAHPLQGQMSRRPDRQMDDRIARNWFPYDLLNVSYDPETGDLYFAQSTGTAIAAYQPDAIPVMPVAEIGANEAIWTVMVFDMIVERFWKKGEKLPALSYTSEMIKVQNRLANRAEAANLPVKDYKPIEVTALTIADLSSEVIKASDGIGKMGRKDYLWMEERYKDRVNVEAINAMAGPGNEIELFGDELRQKKLDDRRSYFDNSPKGLKISHLDSSLFGSRERLLQDRLFIARANYAVQIRKLAEEEFEATKKEVLSWYEQHVRKNREVILGLCGCGPIWVESEMEPATFNNKLVSIRTFDNTVELGLGRRDKAKRKYPNLPSSVRRFNALGVKEKGRRWSVGLSNMTTLEKLSYDKPQCVITGAVASYVVQFQPMVSKDIAMLAGVGEEDLPDVIKVWHQFSYYLGNSILDRLDPMEWKLKNPWQALKFTVGVPLSKRGLQQLQKSPSIPDSLRVRMFTDYPIEMDDGTWNSLD